MSFIKRHTLALKVIVNVAIIAIVVSVLIYIKWFYKPGHGIDCFTYKYFKIYCMGCGSTRQLYYALQGQLKKAFYYNVGCVIIYPAYAYLYYLVLFWTIKDAPISNKQAYVLAAFALVLAIYMIIRNIPLEIFNVLRPVG